MTKLKFCGMTHVSHIVASTDAGADFIGLIFAPSKRQVSPEKAKMILEEARSLRPSLGQHPEVVGVFVNSTNREINEVADYCSLDRVQLHGDERLEDCSTIERPVIKVKRLPNGTISGADLRKLNEELDRIRARGYIAMFDTVSTGPYYGGTGQSLDWKTLGRLGVNHEFLLSGGLNPENVSLAIEQASPDGVDTSSGVETDGGKDISKINAFARAVAIVDVRLQHLSRRN